jgi:hypothetical protein
MYFTGLLIGPGRTVGARGTGLKSRCWSGLLAQPGHRRIWPAPVRRRSTGMRGLNLSSLSSCAVRRSRKSAASWHDSFRDVLTQRNPLLLFLFLGLFLLR